MKLLAVFLTLGDALQCHTCLLLGGVETTHENCPLVECPDNGQQYSCQNEARNHHGITTVKKGCKQRQACENNEKNNWMKSGPRTQCDPSSTTNSVCRCCCTEDECNSEDIFCAKELENTCGKLDMPDLLGLETVCDNFDYEGSTCRFTCSDKNRLLRGATEMKCDGENWVSDFEEEPFCEATCPLPNIKDGALSGSCSDPASGSVVCDFECPPLGYRMEGAPTVNCLRDVQGNVAFWESEIPKCVKITCPALVKLENGVAKCTGNKFEDTCDFECEDGYVLQGFNSLQCLGTQRWSGQYPKCVREIEPVTERVTSSAPNTVVVIPITTTKAPEKIVTTLPSVTTTPTTSRSEATTPEASTSTEKSFTTKKATTASTTTTTRAKTTRQITTTRRTTTRTPRAPAPTRRIVIFPDQTPRPTTRPTTQRVKSPRPMPECPDLVHAATKKVCTSGLFVGSTCEFSCPEGYKIDGPTSATCLSTLKWSNRMPDCTFKVMVERWIVDEAMKLDSNWSKYFHYNPADWSVLGRTNELIEEWIEVDITAGCPTEEMMFELEALLFEKGTEADWESVDSALLANNCRPINPLVE